MSLAGFGARLELAAYTSVKQQMFMQAQHLESTGHFIPLSIPHAQHQPICTLGCNGSSSMYAVHVPSEVETWERRCRGVRGLQRVICGFCVGGAAISTGF